MLYVGVYKFLIFLIVALLIVLVIFTEFVSPVLSVVLFVKGRKGKKNISIDHNKILVWRPFFAKRNFYFRRSEFVNNKTNKKYRFIEFGRRFNDYISKPGAILSFIGFAHVILSGLIVCFGVCFITNGLINGVDKIFLKSLVLSCFSLYLFVVGLIIYIFSYSNGLRTLSNFNLHSNVLIGLIGVFNIIVSYIFIFIKAFF